VVGGFAVRDHDIDVVVHFAEDEDIVPIVIEAVGVVESVVVIAVVLLSLGIVAEVELV